MKGEKDRLAQWRRAHVARRVLLQAALGLAAGRLAAAAERREPTSDVELFRAVRAASPVYRHLDDLGFAEAMLRRVRRMRERTEPSDALVLDALRRDIPRFRNSSRREILDDLERVLLVAVRRLRGD